MIVVADTSPLRYLALLGCLEILPRLFGRIYCPAEVLRECQHPRAPEVLRLWAKSPPGWLIEAHAGEAALDLAAVLDAGEAEAITLAQRLQGELILIDEQKGRLAAQMRGIATAGTLNILAQAGVQGWLDYPSIANRLKTETNFRATWEVIDAAWRVAQMP